MRAEFAKNARGDVVVVSTGEFRGRRRVDLREHFTPSAGAPPQPTRRGVSIRIEDLPRLRAAIEEAEREALRRGDLELEDFKDAGLEPPAELLDAAAGRPHTRNRTAGAAR
jgi:Transcriptional Coactivator p15 (PC4)